MFVNRFFSYLLEYNDNCYLIICTMFIGKIRLPMVVLKLSLSSSIDDLEHLV